MTQAIATWFAVGGEISLLFLKFPFQQARASRRTFPCLKHGPLYSQSPNSSRLSQKNGQIFAKPENWWKSGYRHVQDRRFRQAGMLLRFPGRCAFRSLNPPAVLFEFASFRHGGSILHCRWLTPTGRGCAGLPALTICATSNELHQVRGTAGSRSKRDWGFFVLVLVLVIDSSRKCALATPRLRLLFRSCCAVGGHLSTKHEYEYENEARE